MNLLWLGEGHYQARKHIWPGQCLLQTAKGWANNRLTSGLLYLFASAHALASSTPSVVWLMATLVLPASGQLLIAIASAFTDATASGLSGLPAPAHTAAPPASTPGPFGIAATMYTS